MARHFDDLQLGSIEIFCLAAEAGSFTAAAVSAGLTPAAVSRSIARLEGRLGVRLFVRSTRSVRLSASGRAYLAQCRQALSLITAAERDLAEEQTSPRGTIKISMPTAYGHYRVLPLLPQFRERYPHVAIDVHLSNRNVDFAEGFDLAIRGRVQPDSTLVARKLEDAELVVVATPAYLKTAGTPVSITDLRNHECIQFVLPSDGRNIPWLFSDRGRNVDVTTSGHYCCSDDVLGVVTLARCGAGLVQTYRFIVADDLRTGKLVEVLRSEYGRSRPFSLLYPHRDQISASVRALVDFLIAVVKPLSDRSSPRKLRR